NYLVATQTIATNWLRQAMPAAESWECRLLDGDRAEGVSWGATPGRPTAAVPGPDRRPVSSTANVIKRSQVRLGRWMPARRSLVRQTQFVTLVGAGSYEDGHQMIIKRS